jgi:hypothetical protein
MLSRALIAEINYKVTKFVNTLPHCVITVMNNLVVFTSQLYSGIDLNAIWPSSRGLDVFCLQLTATVRLLGI